LEKVTVLFGILFSKIGKIYSSSDHLIRHWMPSNEEIILKSFNLNSTFFHFSHNLRVPVGKITINYPQALTNNEFNLNPQFTLLAPKKKENTKDIETAIMEDLNHLASLSPYFRKMKRRAIGATSVAVPFYFIWKQLLPMLDSFLYFDFFTTAFEPLLSLPLAYTLIKISSYQRCIESAEYIKVLLNMEINFKRTVITKELEKLEALSVQGDEVKEAQDKLRTIFNDTGVKIVVRDDIPLVIPVNVEQFCSIFNIQKSLFKKDYSKAMSRVNIYKKTCL
jgi:hypothetical protein